ncbi:BRO-N domain-containing protein [Insolitispirillum peregrinum]|nr:BRO family protein [Insolitispirillum peregrinum]
MNDDQPWFVLADVCKAIQLSSHKGGYEQHVRKLDADEKRRIPLSTLERGNPTFDTGVEKTGPCAWMISEAGLYTIMMRCDAAMTPGSLPYRFRKWVTSEVLPTIRRTGSYQGQARVSAVMTPPAAITPAPTGIDPARYAALLEQHMALKDELAACKAVASDSSRTVNLINRLVLETTLSNDRIAAIAAASPQLVSYIRSLSA